MADVKFRINADGSGAIAAINSVQRRVGGLSSDLNSNLKGKIAGAFSAAAIGLAVHSMIDFADATLEGADALGVTTQKYQALKIAARESGIEQAKVNKVMDELEKSARSALGGDTKKANAFANLGISTNELQSLNKAELFSRMLQGTAGMSRNTAVDNMTAVGGKAGKDMIPVASTLSGGLNAYTDKLKSQGRIADDEQLAQLSELKDKWEELGDTVKVAAIPALTWLIDAITNFGIGVKQIVELVGTGIGALVGQVENFDVKGLITAFGDNVVGGFTNLFTNLWDVIRGKLSVMDAVGNVVERQNGNTGRLIEGAFGKEGFQTFQQVIQDKLLEQAEEDKQRALRAEAKKTERAKAQAGIEGDARRQATVSKTAVDKSILGSDLKGDNGFLKIGGLSGINAAYRAERLQREANDYLKQIAKNTEPDNTPDTSGFSEFTY